MFVSRVSHSFAFIVVGNLFYVVLLLLWAAWFWTQHVNEQNLIRISLFLGYYFVINKDHTSVKGIFIVLFCRQLITGARRKLLDAVKHSEGAALDILMNISVR